MSLHNEHRERMDRRIRKNELHSLEEHEQLEFILYNVFQRGDTNQLAHRLLERFRTINGVLNAPYEELITVEGVGNRTAMFLTNLRAILGVVERKRIMPGPPRFDKIEVAADFIKTYFYGKLHEETYLFSLNSSYRLLGVSKVSDGIAGEAYIYPAKLVRQALKESASAVVIAHNHPGGDVNPSTSDVLMNETIQKAFDAVDIELLDSVIVTETEYFSFRGKGYLNSLSDGYYK